jgi:hypothetical protein
MVWQRFLAWDSFPAAWPHEPGFIPGVIPGASWPVPQPTAAGHKARRYNRLRSPEELATPIPDGEFATRKRHKKQTGLPRPWQARLHRRLLPLSECGNVQPA